MPVHLVLNLIPPASESGEDTYEGPREQQEVISAHGAQRTIPGRQTVKIRIPPRNVEGEVDKEGAGVQKGVEKSAENGVEQTKVTTCGK